jgi:hypothetical protein
MLIELEPAKPGFQRVWVTNGFDDFDAAVRLWVDAHRHGCNLRSAPHLSVEDTLFSQEHDIDHDRCCGGVRRVWVYCCANDGGCGQKVLVLGPVDGGDMPPLFPRVQ